MKIADYGKAITSYIESPTKEEKNLLKLRAEESNRTFLAEGTPPPRKPKQLKDLFNSIDTAVLSVRSNTVSPEIILPNLEKKTQEYIKEGLISGEDARKFAIERKEYWDKWIEENPGGDVPSFEFDNEGKSKILSQEEIIERINEADGGRIGFDKGSSNAALAIQKKAAEKYGLSLENFQALSTKEKLALKDKFLQMNLDPSVKISKNIRKTPYGKFRFQTETFPPMSKTFDTLQEAEAFRDELLLKRGVKPGARRVSDPDIGKYKSVKKHKHIKFNRKTYEVLFNSV